MYKKKWIAVWAATVSIALSSNIVEAAVQFKNVAGSNNDVTDCNTLGTSANGCSISISSVTLGSGLGYWVDPATNATDADLGIVRAHDADNGFTYAMELFKNGSPSLPSGNGAENGEGEGTYAAVTYTIDGSINKHFFVKLELDGAKFAKPPLLFVANQNDSTGVGTAGNDGEYTTSIPIDTDEGGEATGTNSAAFKVFAGTELSVSPEPFSLIPNDKLAILYQIKDAEAALGVTDGEVKLTIELKTIDGVAIHPTRTVVIANSRPGLNLAIEPLLIGTVKISSAEESKLFTEGTSPGEAWVGEQEVCIGKIELEDQRSDKEVTTSNGVEEWSIGQYIDTKVKTETTLLKVTSGQFEASVNSSAKVYLNVGGVKSPTADTIGTEEATWQLSSEDLDAIAEEVVVNAKDVKICFEVDGSTPINMPENPPLAELGLDFEEDTVDDPTLDPVELPKFTLDGAICTLYNIPNANAPDSPTVRITNQTTTVGTLKCEMWDQEGTTLIPASTPCCQDADDPSKCSINPYETKRLSVQDLEGLVGGSWKQRGVLKITSNLAKIEVFGMLRDKATGIVTNISAGASGSGCEF